MLVIEGRRASHNFLIDVADVPSSRVRQTRDKGVGGREERRGNVLLEFSNVGAFKAVF